MVTKVMESNKTRVKNKIKELKKTLDRFYPQYPTGIAKMNYHEDVWNLIMNEYDTLMKCLNEKGVNHEKNINHNTQTNPKR